MTSLFRKFTWWLQRRRKEDDLREELQFHLELETQKHVANGISPDGSTIVGYGTRNGNQEAFVAVIPEPATTVSVVLPAAALTATRRRRRRCE